MKRGQPKETPPTATPKVVAPRPYKILIMLWHSHSCTALLLDILVPDFYSNPLCKREQPHSTDYSLICYGAAAVHTTLSVQAGTAWQCNTGLPPPPLHTYVQSTERVPVRPEICAP